MSEVVGEAVIHVRTDSSGVDVTGEGKRAGAGYTRGFVSNLKGIAAGILGALAVREVIGFAKDAVAEGREAQKVGAATAQLIKTTGGAANVTAAQMGKLTTSISNKIGVDDEAIQSAANLVLAFKNVRNEAGKGNDVFDRTIRAGQDLAAAGFGSAESASKALAKALDSPAKGMAALTRLGVRLTDSQTAQVEAFIKSGDTLSAQKFLLDQVEGKVGGVAAATATAGERSSVAWANVKEAIGTALLPSLDAAESAFADKVAPAIMGVLDGSSRFGQGLRTVGRLAQEGFGIAERAVAPLLDRAGELARAALPEIRDAVEELLPPLIDLAQKIAGDVVTAVDNLMPVLAPLIEQAFQLAQSFRMDVLSTVAPVISAIGDALVSVTAFLGEHATAVQAVLVAVGAMIVAFQLYQGVMAVVRAVTVAYTAVQAALNVVMSANPIALVVLALVGLAAGLIYAYKHSETFRNIVDSVFSFIKSAIPNAIGFVVDFVKSHWQLLLAIFGGPLGLIVGLVIKHFGAIKSTVTSVFGTVREVIGNIVSAIAGLPGKIIGFAGDMLRAGKRLGAGLLDGIADMAKGAGGLVAGIASSAFDAIKGLINHAIDLINGAIPNSIGAGPVHIDLPDNPVPHLARGTNNWRGGWSWVGEEGPELLRIPGGSQVVPAGRSAAMAGVDYDALASALVRAGLGTTITIAPQLPTGDPEAAAMAVFNRLAVAGVVG